jgi:cbb3-type cytochrome oxidase subunit 3
MQLSFRNNSAKILYLLLATDLVFFCLHLSRQCYMFSNSRLCKKFSNKLFSISIDMGYAEVFQYIKEYWIILLLGVLAWRNRSLLYSAWSLLFCYLLLYDALKIHERWGIFISNKLGLVSAFGIRSIDFGEIIVSACFGILFFAIIAIAYRFGKKIERKHTQYLILMLLALAFFGIVTDTLGITITNKFLKPIAALIEDGGEHLVMSTIVWFVYDIVEQSNQNILSSKNKSAIASPNQI